ncbi:MAG: S1C family serine protease [Acidobacteriaceae bacterium]
MTAAAVNPIAGSRISLEQELSLIADRLRRSTVRLAGGEGCGSGVIWRPDGVIVSNAHVARAQHLRVELDDGLVLTGSIIARDEGQDLAAIRVAGSAFPTLTVRDARTLRAGEMVVAVGNPMGQTGAASVGIVHSAVRDQSLIIADVRLLPGNSGGPLADVEGRVVGINTLIASGLGCAIPSNVVARFLRVLERSGVA